VDDEALLGNDPVKVATVAMQWLSTQVSTIDSKLFSVWSVRRLHNSDNSSENNAVQNSSEYRAEERQLRSRPVQLQLSMSQYEARREVNEVKLRVNNSGRRIQEVSR
jgi:hypothetical protein